METLEPSRFWWLRKGKYIAIFLREFSSVFILLYALLYLQILSEANVGSTELISRFGTVPFIALSIVILAFSVYNSVTWFFLFPKVQTVKLGSKVLGKELMVLLQLIGFSVFSLLVGWLIYGIII